MAKSFITHKTVTVPAGKAVPHDVTGQFFLCKSATAEFLMAFDGGEKVPMNIGLGWRGEDTFKLITFYNETGSDITVTYYAGRGEMLLWK